MKAQLLGHFAGRGGEKLLKQFAEIITADAVEVMLPFAARLDQTRDPQDARWWLTAGWLWPSLPQRSVTCISWF